MEEDNIVLAKDIEDCDSCPLKDHDCPGGWTSGGSGQPIEPPCCSWNDDTKVYVGMYDREYIYSEQELKWIEEERQRKEEREREERHKRDVEEATNRVYSISKYGNAKIRHCSYGNSICHDWYCPRCHRWFWAGHESWHGGTGETTCNRCGEPLAYSSLLDD